ncbi:MAG: sucrase ferredoxin [Actinomycetota bacterium]
MRVPSCSSVSSALGEPISGTASQVRRWLLIEDPGPWGYDALAHNGVPRPLLDQLRAWARTVSTRPILIRRGPTRTKGARTIYLASSLPGNQWISETSSDDLDAILAVDNESFTSGNVPGRRVERLYLVCTHGRHDRCCSVRGNPVSRVMCAEKTDASWECSHIGGDRFAANVLCLPGGAYFGRVPKEDAVRVTDDYESGTLDLEYFRGWSSWPFAVQAAEIAAREQLDLTRIEDVTPDTWEKTADSELSVRLSTTKFGPLDVKVRLRSSPDEFYLTCRAEHRSRPKLFEIDPITV